MRVVATGIVAALAGIYAASPYISLYKIDRDLRGHDLPALTADIDWTRLRDGLKEDIADGITGVPGQAQTVNASAGGDDLPPFGSGFVTNMAGNLVDQTCNPAHLAEAIGATGSAGAPVRVSRAFFTGPTSFTVAFKVANGARRPPDLRLRLDLVRDGLGFAWKVTRVWMPLEMLAASETHAS
jgi:hypothetical protein